MASTVQEVKKKARKPVAKKVIKKVVSEAEDKIIVSLEAIQQKAYELYERRGGQAGDALQDWLEAKKLLGAGE